MDCPTLSQITANEFYESLPKHVRRRRIPWSGTMELTARCNLRCAQCYISVPVWDEDALERELSTEECVRVIDELVDEGCLCLLLTGGEPLVREDFPDIYTYAKKKGLILKLFTNGTMLTPALADHLAEWAPHSVEITLYGNTESVYEQVTGVKGSYVRCIRGIEMLMDRGVEVLLKTVVLKTNKHELWAMRDYARQLGLRFRFDPVLNHRIDGDPSPERFRLDPAEVVALDVRDGDRIQALQDFSHHFFGPPPVPENLYQCGAGVSSFHVDANGRLSVCIMSRSPSYDLRNGSFRSGWNGFLPVILQQKRTKPSPCQACDLSYLCDQCPGWGQLEHGDPEARVEFLCKIAHLRARAIGIMPSDDGEYTYVE